MAIWQFDCNIVPKKNVTTNDCIVSDEILTWGIQSALLDKIDFLEKEKSWSSNILQYGKEDETCIEFFYEKGFLMEISCRFDLRSLSKKKLKEILDYVDKIEGMILYENKIYFPRLDEIIELLKKSKANKFCQNTTNFFEDLSNS